MHGTLPAKVGRVIANLISHPGYIPRWTDALVAHKRPLDLEIPWFSYAAIDFLENYLRPEMTAFEYGTGGSTLFFSQRVKAVLSVEDNPEWYNLVTQRLSEKSVSNVCVKLHPFDFKNPVGFENSEYFQALPLDTAFDVIVVDGSEEWTQVRPHCFARAQRCVRPGGIIVVDDSWRYPLLREQNRAKDYKIFQSVGPGRPGVTSTDIYFY